MLKMPTRHASPRPVLDDEVVQVLVGPDQREFVVHRRLLCASSAYFRDSLDAIHTNHTAPDSPTTPVDDEGLVMWLSAQSPDMFELFLLWLYQRHAFRGYVDDAMASVPQSGSVSPAASGSSSSSSTSNTSSPSPEKAGTDTVAALHWNLVRLHLFAALIDVPALQDVAMDALQDLYLRCDWDVSPRFMRFLYSGEESDPLSAFRLRKWAVAMMAWAVSNRVGDGAGSHAVITALGSPFQVLFDRYPDLRLDYTQHLDKMVASRADLMMKNPQLRVPANNLRNEVRHFGFRQCSFHSHRKVVGEGKCPHLPRKALGSGSPSPTLPVSTSKADAVGCGYEFILDYYDTNGTATEHLILSPIN